MCGIIALVSFRNHRANLSRLEEMARLIRHRGPDDEGYVLFDAEGGGWEPLYGSDTPTDVRNAGLLFAPRTPFRYASEKFNVALAHRRLSIIDLAPTGHQPMCDESGRYWIAYNGEIYNYRAIRRDLENLGHRFFGPSDTEVVLKAFMEWGPDCQKRFNGMWAVVIWDREERSLWVSRDRFGVKPLFYSLRPDFLVICSEIKSILPLAAVEPNLQEACAYLLDGPNESHAETLYRGIRRFPAGASCFYRPGSPPGELSFDRFYELEAPACRESFSEKKLQRYSEEYYHLLKDAVGLRLHADVKVSCALSGGLDSSSITHLARELAVESGKPAAQLATVSNIYTHPATKSCDESGFIDLAVERLSVGNLKGEPDYETIGSMNDYGLWCYENCYDELPAAAMNTFKICRRHDIKVNLDGQGADEITGGYLRYWSNYFAAEPKTSSDYLLSLLRAPVSLREKTKALLRVKGRNNTNLFFRKRIGDRVLQSYLKDRISQQRYGEVPVNRALHLSVQHNLKKLLRNVDCYSMAISVESRQPFMDYRLIEFMNGLPSCYKLRGGWTKYIARIAFRDKLPDAIVWRKDKMGWPQPIGFFVSECMGARIQETIKNSRFLEDVVGGIDDCDMEWLMARPKLCLRMYNLARTHHIFMEGGFRDVLTLPQDDTGNSFGPAQNAIGGLH
ncbi:MAG: asparagine synthase (glutamine-hydrolyzing) [Desulfobacteraceae bacterium]|nr:MAG: asparagine synthase (glutamine-hydrolyzing) [Desulfobacteraceae bacterium]